MQNLRRGGVSSLALTADEPRDRSGAAVFHRYYHQVPFKYLIHKHRREIGIHYTDKPRALRARHLISPIPIGETWAGQQAWDHFWAYAQLLEAQIANLLRRRSVAAWIHIYRRIGVMLGPGLDGKADAHTLALVRDIVELSITKYGHLDGTGDISFSTHVKPREVLGGYFMSACRAVLGNREAVRHFKEISEQSQWVLTQFEPRDLIDIFYVEGLAYEYWRSTAALSAIGKGASIKNAGGAWIEFHEGAGLSKLIESYDERIRHVRFAGAIVGAWFGKKADIDAKSTIIIPSYNIYGEDNIHILAAFGINHLVGRSNFILSPLDIESYRNSTRFIAKPFRDKMGFSIDDVLCVVWSMCYSAVLTNEVLANLTANGNYKGPDSPIAMQLINLSQRGYSLINRDKRTMIGLMHLFAKDILTNLQDVSNDGLEKCFDYFTLNEGRSNLPSLWSSGRRYPLIPFANGYIADLEAIGSVLHNLFVGVRDDLGLKGDAFEVQFRSALREHGFDLARVGRVKFDDSREREIDASVRIGDRLVLFECRAMERPLDFEIGRIATMRRREEQLRSKVGQALTLKEFIERYPVGQNYNFGWANSVEVYVVSPFVEFIPSLDAEFWVGRVPRVLEADEAIQLLEKKNL